MLHPPTAAIIAKGKGSVSDTMHVAHWHRRIGIGELVDV